MINRLGELDAFGPDSSATSTNTHLKTPLLDKNDDKADEVLQVRTDPEISAFLRPYEPINSNMELIRSNTDKIVQLTTKEGSATVAERKDIMAEMDQVMAQTTTVAKAVKQSLALIKRDNEEYEKKHPSSVKTRIRQGFFETHTRRFRQDMNEYNQESFKFKQSLQDRTKRQLQNLDKKLSDSAIDEIIEEGKAEQVTSMLFGGADAQELVRDIEARHEGIQRLEKQVLEVYELFKDLATLVETQQESLDLIEKRVATAKEHVSQAEGELELAEGYQRKSRKKQCCLIIILLAVLIAILAPTLASTLATSA